jgi:hypothetical protein
MNNVLVSFDRSLKSANYVTNCGNNDIQILVFISQDGPMSSFGINEPDRPDTMIRFELWSKENRLYWDLVFCTNKMSSIPFHGHGSNDWYFLRSIAWKAKMWDGITFPERRAEALDICVRLLSTGGIRFMPEGVKDEIDTPETDFGIKWGTFYHLSESDYDNKTKVWEKRALYKDGTMTTRFTFVRKHTLTANVASEEKYTLEEKKGSDEEPMHWTQAYDLYRDYLNSK